LPPTSSITYDSFFTLTINNYSTVLEKNFLEYRPGLMVLFDQFGKTDTRGGRFWQGIAEYGTNPSAKYYAGVDTFAQESSQVAIPLVYEWKYLGAALSMTQQEMLENSGPVALADITELRLRQTMRTLALLINQEIYGDGTNYDGKTFVGLGAAISAATTNTVGGISGTEYPWWKNNFTSSAGSFATYGVGGTGDKGLNLWNNCSDGTETPECIISDQNLFEAYNKTNVQYIRYVDASSADLSFQALTYQGKKWYWDRQCPAWTMYMLNRKSIHFVTDSRFKFKWTSPMGYPNQYAFTRLVGLRFFLKTANRMFLGGSNGWSA